MIWEKVSVFGIQAKVRHPLARYSPSRVDDVSILPTIIAPVKNPDSVPSPKTYLLAHNSRCVLHVPGSPDPLADGFVQEVESRVKVRNWGNCRGILKGVRNMSDTP